MLSKKFTAVAGAVTETTDNKFNYVTMLLHGDGTNGLQNNSFVDGGPNTVSITPNGYIKQGSFSPYGSEWSNYLSASNIVGSMSSALGTGDFTVQFWLYIVNTSGSGGEGGFLQTSSSSTGLSTSEYGVSSLSMFRNNASNTYGFGVGPTAVYFSDAGTYLNQWIHVALVRSSGTVRIYLNGVLNSTPTSATTNLTGTYIGIGGYYNGNYLCNSYISNFRITNTVEYSGNFTPSTTPLTAITGTLFLGCQSNRFLNTNSGAEMTINSGTPSVQRFSPFNPTAAYSTATIGGSAFCDGSVSYLTASYNTTNFDWWTTDFTIEAWIYPTTFSGWAYIDAGIAKPTFIGNNEIGGTTNYWCFGPYSDGVLTFAYWNGSAVNKTGPTLKANQWNHIALTKTSSGITLFANGVGSSTTAVSGTPQSSASYPLQIGRGNNTNISGHISDVRIVKGTAIYSGSTYSVPTSPVAPVTNTKLLASMTNAGIYDNAMITTLETVGGAKVSTSVKKYGTGSMAFDGSGDYLWKTWSSNTDIFLTGYADFTVEMWVNFNSLSSTQPLIWVDDLFSVYATSTTQMKVDFRHTSWSATWSTITATVSLATSTWYHVAVVRSGGNTITLYVDGVSKGTITVNDAAWGGGGTLATKIGAGDVYPFSGADVFLNGYIDDLRITKGVARTITVPTEALPNK